MRWVSMPLQRCLDGDDGEAVAATPSAIHKCDLSFLPSFLPSYDSNSATVVAKPRPRFVFEPQLSSPIAKA